MTQRRRRHLISQVLEKEPIITNIQIQSQSRIILALLSMLYSFHILTD
jgi:hypothetical protein